MLEPHELRSDTTDFHHLVDCSKLRDSGFTCFRTSRFLSKRSHVVLRSLRPNTRYVTTLIALSDLSSSHPSLVFFKTLEETSGDVDEGRVSSRRPRRFSLNWHQRTAKLFRRFLVFLFLLVLFLYVMVSIYLLLTCSERLHEGFCRVTKSLGFDQLGDHVCQDNSPAMPFDTKHSLTGESEQNGLFDTIKSWLYHLV